MRQLKKIMAYATSLAMVFTGFGTACFNTYAEENSNVRYEIEDAQSFTKGSAGDEYSIAESSNYSGGKAVGNMNAWSDDGRAYSTTKVNVAEGGMYKITIAYVAQNSGNYPTIDVRANNGEWIKTQAPDSASWDQTTTISTKVRLQPGENTIDVTGACLVWYGSEGSQSNQWANVDYFELEKIEGESIEVSAKSMVESGEMRMTGRTLSIDDSKTMDYSCSGFQFVFTGKGNIEANFTSDNASTMVVDINGTLHNVTIQAGTSDVTLAENLEQGTYTVKTYKVTEAAGYLTQLNKITYYDSNATFKATESSKLKFEFVGDSITCGNQINSDSGSENGYYAFPSLLSRAYGADWNTISCSGRGLMEGYNSEEGWAGSKENQLKDIFKYVSWFRDKDTAYDYSYQPDVLVMGVGSNDLGKDIMQTCGTTVDDFCNQVVETARELREKYPNTYIVWCYGTYLNNDYKDEYKAAVESLNDSNMSFVLFPQMVGGKDGHPNYIQHERMAKILSKNISKKLGTDNPLQDDMHYELEDGTITANSTSAAVKTEDWTTVYSGNKYIGDMNSEVEHPSNGGYVTVPVTAPKAGKYKVTVTYGSSAEKEPTIAVKSNDYEWVQATGTVGTDWNATRTVQVEIYLKAGENTVSVTGAINGSWANMDCIDLEYVEDANEPGHGTTPTPEETTTPSENPTLPGTVRYEAEDAESFEAGAVGSEHTIAESDNYSGGKAVGNMNAWADDGRAYLSKKVNVNQAGTYQITVAYAGSESGNEPEIQVRANNGTWKSVKAIATPAWDQVGKVTLKVNLKAGDNIIDVTGACQVWYGEGQSGQWVNIDYFELAKVADEPDETTTAKPANSNVSNNNTTNKPSTVSKPNIKLSKAKIKLAKNVKSKKIKLTLVKVKNAKGYEIQYSTNSKFKKAKIIKSTKLTYTVKKLKKKKTYYIRVRAYNGKVNGAWSNKKKIKVTK